MILVSDLGRLQIRVSTPVSSVVEPEPDFFCQSQCGSGLLLCDLGILRWQSCDNSYSFSQISTIVMQIEIKKLIRYIHLKSKIIFFIFCIFCLNLCFNKFSVGRMTWSRSRLDPLHNTACIQTCLPRVGTVQYLFWSCSVGLGCPFWRILVCPEPPVFWGEVAVSPGRGACAQCDSAVYPWTKKILLSPPQCMYTAQLIPNTSMLDY